MRALLPASLFFPRRTFTRLGVLLAFFCMVLPCQAAAPSQNFPHYRAISENVAFWEKIYGHYSLNQAVIHDSDDLAKIYEVIPLLSTDIPGAARYNEIFQQHTKEKYRSILRKLAVEKPTTPNEERVFALFPEKNKARAIRLAVDNVRSQRGQKERFLAGVIHSGRYMQEIKRLFRGYNLPEELAYLPHVESSFNFKAYSKYGAAGIWQFTRETGKRYLTIDHTLDERLDPILAAHAAAKYLKNSYEATKSWPLALTSYNYGLSGILRAIDELTTYENIFNNYNKGYFKFASRNFYAEFLAALKVAGQLEQNPKVKIDRPQPARYVHLPGYIRISDTKKRFGVSAETLLTLNPALQSSVINGKKSIPRGYVLRLPATNNAPTLIAAMPSKVYKRRQTADLVHRVKKGDTAISIARYHGISVKSLIQTNKLDKNATVKLQQKLTIPKTARKLAQSEKDIIKISPRIEVKKVTSTQINAAPGLYGS